VTPGYARAASHPAQFHDPGPKPLTWRPSHNFEGVVGRARGVARARRHAGTAAAPLLSGRVSSRACREMVVIAAITGHPQRWPGLWRPEGRRSATGRERRVRVLDMTRSRVTRQLPYAGLSPGSWNAPRGRGTRVASGADVTGVTLVTGKGRGGFRDLGARPALFADFAPRSRNTGQGGVAGVLRGANVTEGILAPGQAEGRRRAEAG
jgi:hypothetical protein